MILWSKIKIRVFYKPVAFILNIIFFGTFIEQQFYFTFLSFATFPGLLYIDICNFVL